MVQTCSKCSRANPGDAVYCYFDGFVLGGHSHNGGPVAVGAQAFAHPFVFPTGRQCRSFDELALACQEEWNAARDLLKQSYLENFFSGLGRVDLAMTAKEAAKFPDADLGLNQLLEKLPSEVLAEPRLGLETQEVNLGVLEPGAQRDFRLHMENQGMRMISGSITSSDAPWLVLGDAAGNQKHFHFQHELELPIAVRSDKLRANNKPLEAHLEIESNGGSFIVTVHAQVPVKPFASGVLAGAKSPRQLAEKAKTSSKEAAALFENGAVAEWYKVNGWTYPVQGPSASGLGAIQQFFEALGLTAPPKVAINTNRIELTGNPGEQLTYAVEIKTQEKRPVYAHGTSSEPWLEVGRARLNGRTATINVSVPSVPNKQGETLTAKLIVQSNGNQRFVVPVTLQVGGNLVFGDAAPAPVESITETPSAPVIVPPTTPSRGGGSYRRRRVTKENPSWLHLVPAALLLLALLIAVIVDRLMPTPERPEQPGGVPSNPASTWAIGDLQDPEPRLAISLDDERERFGITMTKEKDPRHPEKRKKLTYDDHGKSNNTIIKIDGEEFKFGFKTGNNVWGGRRGELKQVAIKEGNRKGWTSTMVFSSVNIEVVQSVEVVPGQSGYLDTVLVLYSIHNKDQGPHKVGIRVMLDTFIGANDGVPFTIPGQKGFVTDKAEHKGKDVPDYIEVIENPNDPKNPGTVVRLGLRHFRLPGVELEDMERLRICRFPGQTAPWEWEPESIAASGGDTKGDSCVGMYWPYETLHPKATRHYAFTYGLSSLELGGNTTLALSVPASVQPDRPFVATAYVWGANKGDKVKLKVPAGLKLDNGESEEKTVEQGGARSQVFWRLRSGGAGNFTLEAATKKSKSKPAKVNVTAKSIFG